MLHNLQIACQPADWHTFCGFSVCEMQSADHKEHIYIVYMYCIHVYNVIIIIDNYNV